MEQRHRAGLAEWERLPVVRCLVGPEGQALEIDGRRHAPYAYMSYLGKPEYYRQAAAAGIHLTCCPLFLGDRGINTISGIGPFRAGVWRDDGRFDLSEPIAGAEEILAADPEAYLIFRVNLDAPAWWEARHPEACCLLPDGTTLRQSFAAPRWRDDTAAALRQILRELFAQPFASRLAGIHVAAGQTEEWFYRLSPRLGFHDANPERLRAFRCWLRDRYADDEERLRAAWHCLTLNFETAAPADISGVPPEPRWRDPDADRPALDTLRFHAETMADTIAFFCRVVKEESHGRILTGAFYGYHYYLTDARWGHGALARLLRCPDLDALASPNAYHRVPGEDWPPMAAIDSVRVHGKLWFAENDTRTCRTGLLKEVAPQVCPPGQYEGGVWRGPERLDVSVNLLKANAARMLAGGYGGWWFDMWGGWFDHPDLLAVLRLLQRVAAEHPSQHIPEFAPEICVVIDEELCHYDASGGRLAEEILGNRYTLGKVGAPYHLVLASDLPALPEGRYGLVWLLGDPVLCEDRLASARRLLRAGGLLARTAPEGSALTSEEGVTPLPGVRFIPADVRAWCRAAGVHVYCDTDDVLYAGRGWLGLHAATAGEKVIHLPLACRATDVATGRIVAGGSRAVHVRLAQYGTVLLAVEPCGYWNPTSPPDSKIRAHSGSPRWSR